LAVELFFVMSGFYMQLVLSTKYTKRKLGSGWRHQFLKARYFRLMPTYLIALFLIILATIFRLSPNPINIWTYTWELPNTAGNIVFKAFLAMTNMTILFQDVTMFLNYGDSAVNLSAVTPARRPARRLFGKFGHARFLRVSFSALQTGDR
jgi:peptidoglycan/LPS O-acetylase OafA/YrhL